MPKPEQHRQSVLRQSATALLEALATFRAFLGRPAPSAAELRRLSETMGSLVNDHELSSIASPRIGRLRLNAPDNKPIVQAFDSKTPGFFVSGGAEILGMTIKAARAVPTEAEARIRSFDTNRIVQLREGTFLAQPVIFYSGHWISRKAVIEYVGSVTSGSYSGRAQTEEQAILDKSRRSFFLRDGKLIFDSEGTITIASSCEEVPFTYSEKGIDVVLWELLSAIHYIVTSPDVQSLELAIKQELKTA